jgi:hypothetical protein
MRLLHVEQALLRIGMAARSGDSEEAHALEDKLYVAVLTEVAKGDCYHSELARAALRSKELQFGRWCA